MNSKPSTALVRVERAFDTRAADPMCQRLWLTIEAKAWRSLVVVPTGGYSSLDLVHRLASVAWQQRGNRLIVADLHSVALSALPAVRAEIRSRVESGVRVLIAIQSFEQSPTSATIARDADMAILCVHQGRTTVKQAKNAVKELGQQRYLGAIFLREPNRSVSADALAPLGTVQR